jgi:amino acid adenylation domain-containing protein
MPVVDLTDLPEKERETIVKELAAKEGRTLFNLSRGPLFRASLLKLQEDEHVLLLTIHHIICDGWSLAVFYKELRQIYGELVSGRVCSLPELPIQYADFAVWQRQLLEGELLEKQLGYWRKQLQGAPARLKLSSDYLRPVVQSHRGGHCPVTFPNERLKKLKALSRREGVSLYMTVLAAFNVLLFRYTNQEDIVVGSPIANRNRTEAEGVIGLFVNTLALRTDLSGDPTFRELLKRVKEVTLGAFDHQDTPFEKVVEDLQPKRSPSYNPIVQVLFGLNNTPEGNAALSGLTLTPIALESGVSKFDLSLHFREVSSGLKGTVEYKTDLFTESWVIKLMERFEVLLDSILADPGQQIAQLSLITGEERNKLVELNSRRKSYSYEESIVSLFEAQVSRTPDAIALTFNNESLTYQDLNHRANKLATYLRTLGVGPEVLVAICIERSVEMVIGILAILKSGGAYVPLDPAYPEERIGYILKDSGSNLLVVQKGLSERFENFVPQLVVLDSGSELITSGSADNLNLFCDRNSLAYVIYTSGSTGNPKGVMVTHQNVVRLLRSTEDWFGFNETDVWTLFHSFAFDFSVWEIWGALAYGGRLVIVPYEVSRSPGDFYRLLRDEGVTVLNQTPSAFRALANCTEAANSTDHQPTALRYVIFGGEALDFRILQPWIVRHRGVPTRLINMYGITETTVHVTFREISESDIGSANGSLIGEPIPDLALYILDQHMQPVPVGVPGEMYVAGAGLARGYLNRSELTAERFVENPYGEGDYGRLYKTGDRARYIENGDIEYLGRADNQVKIRGFRIELGEIEAAIGKFNDVSESVVTVTTAEDGDKRLAAYFVSASESKIDSAELRGYLKRKLPDHMIPAAFVQLERIPLTANGKVDRKSLPAPTGTLSSDRNGFEAPKTETERALTKIWQDMFDIEEIGLHDNFFEMGGHSLMAIKMFAAVEKRFGKKPPLAVLFESGTIKTLAESIAESLWEDSDPSLVPIQPNGTRPPLYCFHAGGGNVLFYSDLAKRMGSDQPMYGLQARRSGNRQLAHDTVEDMAAYYLAEITRFQPNGPYYLCGSSFGGLLAFEAAQILHRSGKDVGIVALLDTNAPGYPKLLKKTTPIRQKWYVFLRRFQHHRESLVALNAARRKAYIASRLRKVILNSKRRLRRLQIRGMELFYSRLQDGKELPKQYLQLENKIGEANKGYRPGPYPGKVTLFRAEKQPLGIIPEPTLGWQGLPAELEIHEIPGHHGSIVAEPYVEKLSIALRDCLDQAERVRATFELSETAKTASNGARLPSNGSMPESGGTVALTSKSLN